MGFIFVPLTTLSVSTLRQDQIQQATGLYSLLRNLGASLGISVMISMQVRAALAHQATLVSHATPYDLAYRMDSWRLAQALRGWAPLTAAGASVGMLYREVLQQAALLSYLDSFRWMALICIVCCPLAFVFTKGRAPSGHVAME
jgi:DHA2 family multidrug resistance protein